MAFLFPRARQICYCSKRCALEGRAKGGCRDCPLLGKLMILHFSSTTRERMLMFLKSRILTLPRNLTSALEQWPSVELASYWGSNTPAQLPPWPQHALKSLLSWQSTMNASRDSRQHLKKFQFYESVCLARRNGDQLAATSNVTVKIRKDRQGRFVRK